MPLPDPHKGESQQDFVSRCIAAAIGDNTFPNTTPGREQAAAACYDTWRNRDKPKKAIPPGDGNAAVCSEPNCPMSDAQDSADCQRGDCPMHAGQMAGYAYATFEVKSFDNDQRVIEGIASTPTPDRIGDIMNPLGAKFSLPMPLLWQHDSKAPIGQVIWAEAREGGIPFKAKIASVAEPGRLKDRLDEAWQSIKAGLVRAVSIGFNAASDKVKLLKGGGFQYDEWSWLELSAVTIPANAEASITNIRSIDQEIRAKATSLNSAGHGNARARVAAGDVNDSDPWSFSADDGNKLLGPSGDNWGEYGRWFLGVDSSAAAQTKDRYKYPFGKNGKVYTSALRAIRSRASQQGATEVFNAAGKLLDSIEGQDKPGQASAAAQSKKVKPAAAVASRSIKLERPTTMAKTNAERMKDLEAKRAAELAARDAIQAKIIEEDRTKDEAEQNAFDEHSMTIKALDRELADCRLMEKELIAQAKPVTNGSGLDIANPASITVKAPTLPPGIAFIKSLACEMHARLYHRDVFAVARQHCGQWPQVENFLQQKAAVAVGTTTSGTWAGPLVYAQNLASEFLEFLVPQTYFGRIPGLTMVPFNSRVPRETSVITAQWVGEGRAKPAQAESFDSVTLTYAKMAAIMGVTQELARFSSPSVEMLVRNNLAKGIAKFLDAQFITPSVTAVTGQNPASITNGADTDTASGTDITAVIHDIREILYHFQEYNIPTDNLILIMQPVLATSIGTMMTTLGVRQFPDINGQGGSILGVQVITSNNSPSGQITAIHPPSVFVADDGGLTIDVSTEASVEMQDNPTSTDWHLVSAFQNNLMFVRAERFITWVRGRDKGVYYLTAAAYGGAVTG